MLSLAVHKGANHNTSFWRTLAVFTATQTPINIVTRLTIPGNIFAGEISLFSDYNIRNICAKKKQGKPYRMRSVGQYLCYG